MRPGLVVEVVCLVVRGARVVRGERLVPNIVCEVWDLGCSEVDGCRSVTGIVSS